MVCFTGFINNSISHAWYAFLAIYLTQLGATTSIIGSFFAMMTLLQFGSRLPGGVLGDYIGRKNSIVLSLVMRAIFSFLAFLTNDLLVTSLLIGGTLFGIGLSLDPTSSLVTESVPASQTGTAFGIRAFFLSFGFVIGPLVTGATKDFGFSPLFLMYGVVSLFSGFISWVFITDPSNISRKQKSSKKDYKESQKNPRSFHFWIGAIASIWMLLTSFLFWSLRNGMTGPFRSLLTTEILKLNIQELSIMFSLFSGGIMIGSLLLGKVSDSLGSGAVVIISFISVGALDVVWILLGNTPGVIAIYTIMGFFTGGINVIAAKMIAQNVPREIRSSVLGFAGFSTGVASSTGSLLGGFIWNGLGPLLLILIGSFSTFLGVLFLSICHFRNRTLTRG